jgi:hypothetical protein
VERTACAAPKEAKAVMKSMFRIDMAISFGSRLRTRLITA